MSAGYDVDNTWRLGCVDMMHVALELRQSEYRFTGRLVALVVGLAREREAFGERRALRHLAHAAGGARLSVMPCAVARWLLARAWAPLGWI